MKKIISLLLVLAMFATLFAACGTTKPAETKGPAPAETKAAVPETEAAVPETEAQPEKVDLNAAPDLSGVTIRIMTNSSITSGVDYSTILPRWKQVEERTGCKIIWEVIDTDYDTVLNTRLAGDPSEAPDIVIAGSVTGAASYIDDGLFYNITKCYDECPNIKNFYTVTNPEMAKLMTYTDGGIYQFATATYISYDDYIESQSKDYIENHLWYRKDLAEAMGFTEPPKTIDDWYNLLVAAKEHYPDMNIFDTKKVHSSWSSLSVFAGSYGLQMNHNNAGNYFALTDDGVIFEPATDAAKAWLTEMSKWYAAGLLNDGYQTSELYTNGSAGITFASFWRGMRNHVTELLAENPEIEYQACPIPTVEGYERCFIAREPYGGTLAIVDNGDEEQCLNVAKFLDYSVYSTYGIACERLGPEGVVWEFDENGKVALTDDAKNYTSVEINGLGSYMWSKFPSVFSSEINNVYSQLFDSGAEDSTDIDPRLLEYEEQAYAATAENLSYSTQVFVVPYMNEDDQAEAQAILADLNTFTQEMMTAYIMGNKDINNFQTEFVDVLYDTFRLQDLLDIYNKYV